MPKGEIVVIVGMSALMSQGLTMPSHLEVKDMARRIWLEGHDSLARRSNDPFCGHLSLDGVLESLRWTECMRKFLESLLHLL